MSNHHKHTLLPNRFREAAVHNLRVFPAQPRSKTPVLMWKDYQTEPPIAEDLARWDNSDFNVCAVTGTPNGVVVLVVFRSVPL